MTDRELFKRTLEVLEDTPTKNGVLRHRKAIEAIRARLAQPGQEPVATVQCINGVTIGYLDVMQPVGTKLYTAPQPAVQPVPLTNRQIGEIISSDMDEYDIARVIEAAHNIK